MLCKFQRSWFLGTVDDVTVDDAQTLFHVTFEDFNEQEMDLGEVHEHVIYHPELDKASNGLEATILPQVGTMVLVLFVENYDPHIEVVVEVREEL